MKRKSPRTRVRTRILTISIPLIYATWLALSSMWAVDRESARTENRVATHSFDLISESDLTALHTNCFKFNSEAWLRGPRLANANYSSSGIDYSFGKELISSSVIWSNDNLPTLLEQSICERNSRFVERDRMRNFETDVRLWVVRLVYMYLHFHQHRHAFHEAQALDPHCLVERRAAGIGPFDYECKRPTNMRYSAVPALMAGLATERVVLFVNNASVGPPFLQQPWSQVACDRRDAQCFFLPASPCVLTHEEIQNAYSLQKKERRQLFRIGTLPEDRNEDRVLLLQLPFRAQRVPEKLRDKIYTNVLLLIQHMTHDPDLQRTLMEAADRIRHNDDLIRNESFTYYGMDSPIYHALLLYALRPNPVASKQMDEIVNAALPPEFESGESIGLPIRASDKCDVEMECMPFQDHLDAAQESWKSVSHMKNQKPFVVVTTESKKIKEEVQSLKRTNGTNFAPVFVMNQFDITQDTGYFEPTLNDPTESQTAILSAMSSLKLQLLSRMTLGNCCSSFHLMLKDILSEGCGAHHDHVFQCLQTHENPRFRTCCSWDKSAECVERREKARTSTLERA